MNPTTGNPASDINSLMQQEFNSARKLCDILESERDALASNQLDRLNDLAARKQAQVEELEALGKNRLAWFSLQGMKTDSDTLNVYFTSTGKEHQQAWNALLAQLEKCRQLNRVNGSIVEQLQKKIRNALSIIQGRPDDTDLYDQRGKSTAGSTNSILTRA